MLSVVFISFVIDLMVFVDFVLRACAQSTVVNFKEAIIWLPGTDQSILH
jgi:hypothetical protein